jgi:uncharacterized coiled-coil DUF342 family protein
MWISKKKYNELIEQRDEFNRIATNAVAQNGKLLDEWHEVMEEMKSIQTLNHQLIEHNDDLLAHCRELEAKLNLAIKQRDYYYDLLENTSDAYEEGQAISREAE